MSANNHQYNPMKQVDQYNSLIDNIENKLRGMTTRRPPPIRKRSPSPQLQALPSKKAYSEYLAQKKDDPLVHQPQLIPPRYGPIKQSGRSILSEKLRDRSNEFSSTLERSQQLNIPKPVRHRSPVVSIQEPPVQALASNHL